MRRESYSELRGASVRIDAHQVNGIVTSDGSDRFAALHRLEADDLGAIFAREAVQGLAGIARLDRGAVSLVLLRQRPRFHGVSQALLRVRDELLNDGSSKVQASQQTSFRNSSTLSEPFASSPEAIDCAAATIRSPRTSMSNGLRRTEWTRVGSRRRMADESPAVMTMTAGWRMP